MEFFVVSETSRVASGSVGDVGGVGGDGGHDNSDTIHAHILVMKAHWSGLDRAIPLPFKGRTDVGVSVVATELPNLGMSDTVIRNDQGPSLRKL